MNFVGDGAARKPVLFNPIPDVDANTAAAVQDAEIDSDDEDTRPYKCTHCNKGSDRKCIFRLLMSFGIKLTKSHSPHLLKND